MPVRTQEGKGEQKSICIFFAAVILFYFSKKVLKISLKFFSSKSFYFPPTFYPFLSIFSANFLAKLFFFLFLYCGVWLMPSYLINRCSNTWVMTPVLVLGFWTQVFIFAEHSTTWPMPTVPTPFFFFFFLL
jgi:hypothetical protein